MCSWWSRSFVSCFLPHGFSANTLTLAANSFTLYRVSRSSSLACSVSTTGFCVEQHPVSITGRLDSAEEQQPAWFSTLA